MSGASGQAVTGVSLGLQVQQALLHSKEVLLHQLLIKDRALKKRSLHCWISARQLVFPVGVHFL